MVRAARVESCEFYERLLVCVHLYMGRDRRAIIQIVLNHYYSLPGPHTLALIANKNNSDTELRGNLQHSL